MENNALVLMGCENALIESSRGNYQIAAAMGGTPQTLKRDIDFGVIPGTKKPSLYKAGAEKVIRAYGLLPRYEIITKIENFDGDEAFCFYSVECKLIKIADTGTEYVFAVGLGSANTKEKRNGYNNAYNAANSTLKMAAKRALVMAAITIGAISDIFEQDEDNEAFTEKAKQLSATADPEAVINKNQVKRMFAIANESGLNAEQAKNKILASFGYPSSKEIKQKDYDAICKMLAEEK